MHLQLLLKQLNENQNVHQKNNLYTYQGGSKWNERGLRFIINYKILD